MNRVDRYIAEAQVRLHHLLLGLARLALALLHHVYDLAELAGVRPLWRSTPHGPRGLLSATERLRVADSDLQCLCKFARVDHTAGCPMEIGHALILGHFVGFRPCGSEHL